MGSQPAVDGANSSDDVVGWGPRAGYVFQKCFVEFFCSEEDVSAIEQKVQDKGKDNVHYFASNYKVFRSITLQCFPSNSIVRQGECRTNVPEDGRNAVTWGIFPGQEIVQTTIIERESFLTWKVLPISLPK